MKNKIKPLIVGWVPMKSEFDLMLQGVVPPGLWLYKLQLKHLPNRFGKLCGYLFGIFYSNKRWPNERE